MTQPSSALSSFIDTVVVKPVPESTSAAVSSHVDTGGHPLPQRHLILNRWWLGGSAMKCFACTLTALAALTTRADAVAFEASFAAYRDYAIISPRGLVTGDFNGDTKPDVAVASAYDHSVIVMLNVEGGAILRASVASPSGLAVGDFNGDSRLDMAVTNSGEDTVSVLLGNGDG